MVGIGSRSDSRVFEIIRQSLCVALRMAEAQSVAADRLRRTSAARAPGDPRHSAAGQSPAWQRGKVEGLDETPA